MAPWQSGNSFIALGVTYFLSAWYAPKLIARHSTSTILLTGLAIQISGLLALMATFRILGMATTTLTLVPRRTGGLRAGADREQFLSHRDARHSA
jgi:hypothetical protein